MQSSTFILLTCATLLAFVQCVDKKPVSKSKYHIKQVLVSGHRGYEINGQKSDQKGFTVKNELFTSRKQLTLWENGKETYVVKQNVANLMATWTIFERPSGNTLGTIKNKVKFIGSELVAKGDFGEYRIRGDFGNHMYNIQKDGVEVATIETHSSDTRGAYDLTMSNDANHALIILFSVLVDEIRLS